MHTSWTEYFRTRCRKIGTYRRAAFAPTGHKSIMMSKPNFMPYFTVGSQRTDVQFICGEEHERYIMPLCAHIVRNGKVSGPTFNLFCSLVALGFCLALFMTQLRPCASVTIASGLRVLQRFRHRARCLGDARQVTEQRSDLRFQGYGM